MGLWNRWAPTPDLDELDVDDEPDENEGQCTCPGKHRHDEDGQCQHVAHYGEVVSVGCGCRWGNQRRATR